MVNKGQTLMNPRLENLLTKVASKFTLVSLAAIRAREINDYYNHLGSELGKIVPPQVESVSHKSLTIALEEIESEKIEAVVRPKVAEVVLDEVVEIVEESKSKPVTDK
jgi:DNA-directed RNA polymerase subunit omega